MLDAVGEQFGVSFPPPNLAGPFSLSDTDALRSVLEDGGLEPDVREAIANRAMRAGRELAVTDDDGIVFAGSSLIAAGSKPLS